MNNAFDRNAEDLWRTFECWIEIDLVKYSSELKRKVEIVSHASINLDLKCPIVYIIKRYGVCIVEERNECIRRNPKKR